MPPLLDKGTKDFSLTKILLIELSIFIDFYTILSFEKTNIENKINIIYLYYIIQTCLYILINIDSIITDKSKLSDGSYKLAVFLSL